MTLTVSQCGSVRPESRTTALTLGLIDLIIEAMDNGVDGKQIVFLSDIVLELVGLAREHDVDGLRKRIRNVVCCKQRDVPSRKKQFRLKGASR